MMLRLLRQYAQKMLPHNRQWWRLRRNPNTWLQAGHSVHCNNGVLA
jgi:hypothetical protein